VVSRLRCRKCNELMRDGDYIKETYVRGMPDFEGDALGGGVVTVSVGGSGVLIQGGCWKCPKCGLSYSKGNEDLG
jgi:phage FluMu protein Com